MAADCLHKDNPEMLEMSRQRSEQMDQELSSFLSQIGGTTQQAAQPSYAEYNAAQSYIQMPPPYANAAAPWAQPDPNAMAPWAQPDPNAPWAHAVDPNAAANAYPPNPWAMPPPPPPPPQ